MENRIWIVWVAGKPETAVATDDTRVASAWLNSQYGKLGDFVNKVQTFVDPPFDPEFTPERVARDYERDYMGHDSLWAKLKLNSEYPLISNRYSRLYDPTLCEAITKTGQELLFNTIVKSYIDPSPETIVKPGYLNGSLYAADPNCNHDIVSAPGGGVKCTKCPGWFCF